MTWRVFYSYSHKDSEFRAQLGTYLAPLKHKGTISDWYDRQITPGANWQKEISDQLESANLILFLISADFLNSEYCLGVEVGTAMRRLPSGTARVIPILLRECLWQESVFSDIQMIPRDAKPIASSKSIDEAFTSVAKEIRDVVELPPPCQSIRFRAGKAPKRACLRSISSGIKFVHMHDYMRELELAWLPPISEQPRWRKLLVA
jgi:hypothetical protein